MAERFTLLSELGRGGMGVVWKARDEETGQVVALKLLRDVYAEDPDYVARFERELDLARRIDTVHVVKVLGFGVRQKVPYLALEYVDGPSLHDALVAHGPYGWPDTRALLVQLAQGLSDAHAAGVIHRDVKPSNVLIGPDGIAKLTDFGIARGLDLTRVTATSTILGTPAYLAPEGPKDARSDLYSLGVIAYELLTGTVPFAGHTYQDVIIEHMRTPPDLSKVPVDARPIIGWLLAKDPARRPQSAAELLAVLEGKAGLPALAGTPISVATPSWATPPPTPAGFMATQPPYRPAASSRRRPAIVGLAVIACVVAITIGALAAGSLAGGSEPNASPYTAGGMPTARTSATAPTMTVPPTGAPTASFLQYQVQVGDTAASIAARFDVTLADLKAANPQVTDWNALVVGTILNIPPPGDARATATPTTGPVSTGSWPPGATASRMDLLVPCSDQPDCYVYTVRGAGPGPSGNGSDLPDTLSGIVRYFGVDVTTVREMNSWLGGSSDVTPGDKLKIPPPTR